MASWDTDLGRLSNPCLLDGLLDAVGAWGQVRQALGLGNLRPIELGLVVAEW